ncbi:MAG TPA: hypothetical protein VM012_03095 [Flavitalea sp.]|nr:hypothetical protein [Flavitalea sp.]
MKRSAVVLLTKALHTILVFLIISCFSFFIIAKTVNDRADDIWKQLGIPLTQANQNIRQSFIFGHLQYLGTRNAKNIAPGERISMINQLVAYAKKYWNSKEFQADYKNYRAHNKPADPERMLITAESIKIEEKARLEKALKTAEEGLNSPNPKIKNGAPLRIENVKKELAALDNPDNLVIKRRLDDVNRSFDYALKQQGTAMEKFSLQYPEDPKELLKKRLQEMLTITAEVDYDAELKDVNKFKMFVNPDYEKKPKEWKLAFRAGQAATDAVRAAAQQWLKELN